jgi:hypothetical protein
MLPFFLYLIAGALTGFQVYSLLALGVYGAPVSPLEFLSLLGSLVLIVAAYLSLWKPRVAARVALLAALTIWCFYAPASLGAVRSWRASHGPGPQLEKGAR